MVSSDKLAEFFTLGRKIGWDTSKREWNVIQLMDAKGVTPTLVELGLAFEGNNAPKWSGDGFGDLDLREAIRASQGYELDVKDILVTLGAQQANLLAFAALVSSGDRVLFELPTWMHAIGAAQMLGVEPLYIRRQENLGWRFDLDELKIIFEDLPKLFYFCNPNNPTGVQFSSQELDEICNLAEEYGVWVVCDEVYRGLQWENRERPSPLCDVYPRGISTNSVSKTVALDALRLGWIATSDRSILARCAIAKQLNSTPHVSYFDEVVAKSALQPEMFNRIVGRSIDQSRMNRDLLIRWIAERIDLDWHEPDSGFLSFPRYNLDIESWELCETLLGRPYKVYLIPGICYAFENHVRISYGPNVSQDAFQNGLEILGSALDEIGMNMSR